MNKRQRNQNRMTAAMLFSAVAIQQFKQAGLKIMLDRANEVMAELMSGRKPSDIHSRPLLYTAGANPHAEPKPERIIFSGRRCGMSTLHNALYGPKHTPLIVKRPDFPVYDECAYSPTLEAFRDELLEKIAAGVGVPRKLLGGRYGKTS